MLISRGFRVPTRSWSLLLTLITSMNAVPALGQRALDIQPGGRQNGLGSAGVALFGDPSDALWWNPAALGFADRMSFQYTYAKLLPGLADLPYHHVTAAAPLGTWGGFGTSFTHLDYGEFLGIENSDSSPSIAIGIRVHPRVSIGANLKWVQVSGILSGETFSTDIGALLRLERESWGLGFGAMYQNLGGKIDVPDDVPSLPLTRNYKIGASATVPMRMTEEVTVGAVAVVDYNKSDLFDGFHTWNGGVETHVTYDELVRFAVRGGYYYDPSGEIEDFTFGAGLRVLGAALDAGWIPQAKDSDLDRVVKITAGIHIDLSAGRPRWPMD